MVKQFKHQCCWVSRGCITITLAFDIVKNNFSFKLCPFSPDYVSIELHWRTGLREKIRWSTRTNGLLHLLIIWIFQWMYPVYYVHRRQNNFNRYPPYNISLRFLFFLPAKLVLLIETLCMAISHLVQELLCIINNCR